MSALTWKVDSEPRTGGLLITDNRGGVATVTQRDPHPVNGNGVTWDECAERARLIAAAPSLLSALEELLERMAVPDSNCSCHISPPCNDCVEYGGLRETMEFARRVIATATGVEQ
jgi:hypothetical protein